MIGKLKLLLCMLGIICLLLQVDFSFAQEGGKIKGTIVDAATGKPLVGATVSQYGVASNSTVANDAGKFELNVPANARLVVTVTGYKSKTISAANKDMTISLDQSASNLNEVVVVGYGTQRKSNITGAVSSINANDISLIPTSNLSNVLAGRLSGAFVRGGTGTPGIGSEFRIRSQTSWNGNGVPVFVIDGIVSDQAGFDALDPNEVAEITVLKDAASAAIYGSRSSNGVVLITTKTGRSGKPVIIYSSQFSTQRTGKLPEYMDMSKALDYHIGVNGGISPEEKAWVLKNNPGGMNYYNAAYSDPNNMRHALSASGGNEMITYYVGGSYFKENGFLPNVWFKKYNLRSNLQAKLTKDLTLGLNVATNYGTRNRFNFTYDYGSPDLNNLWGKLLYWDVFSPAYIDGKAVNPGWLGNPVEMMKNGGYWRNNFQQIDALVSAEYKIPMVPGLSVRGSYSKNYDNTYIKNFAKKQLLYNFKREGANSLMYTNEVVSTQKSGDPGTEYIGNESAKASSYQLNGQINYSRQFGEHNVNATAVYEQYEYDYSYFSMYRYNFPLYPTDQFFAASQNRSDWTTSGNERQDGRLSYIGRVAYEYAGKYLLSASVRRDGSVKFSPENRWGWFPSVSGGWMLSKENFFSRTTKLSFIDMLKLRVSYGVTGNDEIGGWQWIDQYNIQNSTYYLGNPGTAAPRLAYAGIPNENLTWEKSNAFNAGFDLRMFNKLTFSAEFWKRHSFDILGSRVLVLPVEFGGAMPASNYGIIDSKGMEFDLGYADHIGKNFTYAIKGNFGLATTKVKLRDYAANAQPIDNPNGKTLGYGAGLKATGIFRSQADIDKLPGTYTINGAKPELGMMNFEDLSGPDGKPDGMIDNYDRVIVGDYMGSGAAPISYGLSINLGFKGFSLDMLFAGLANFKNTYNDPWGRNFGGGGKIPKYHDDAWSAENPNGSTPKLYAWGDARATYVPTSTFNTYDGSFLRMKYLNLAYSIPSSITNKARISDVKIFLSGTNLFCLSKFKFYDPEVFQFMSYPVMKTFTVGLDIRL